MENAIPTSRRKITYPTPSLNKLSPAILVSKPFESFACFSIPITATGSVGEINAPKIKAKIKGSPVNKLNPNPMIIVDNKTPKVAIRKIGKICNLKSFTLICSAPAKSSRPNMPSKRALENSILFTNKIKSFEISSSGFK